MALGLSAQSVEFSFKSGIYLTSVKQSIERNISSLLTAINRASNSNGSLSFFCQMVKRSTSSSHSVAALYSPFSLLLAPVMVPLSHMLSLF